MEEEVMKKSLVLALLTLCCLFGAVAPASAITAPGRPTAKAPTGTILAVRPTFTWTRPARAASYEVRVYKGTTLLVKKTGITRLSWQCSKVLPRGASYFWKVRAHNAAGNGSWSNRITFKVRHLAIGDAYQGGKIGYILQSGDPGYVAGQDQGLVVAKANLSTGIKWFNGVYKATGATGWMLGDGFADTSAAIAAQGPTATDYAAGLARACTDGGYTDWYLPCRNELNILYLNKAAIGGFVAEYYWSSTEIDVNRAYNLDFAAGGQYASNKNDGGRVRAVRTFPATTTKAITAFSFEGLSSSGIGAVTEADYTIAVTVPFGTDVSALVATFTTSGTAVKVGAVPQVTGVTANNFASPVTYKVTAANASTQTYVVTVTVAAHAVGDSYQGGIVAYILQAGDPGYVVGETHGLIAAAADQNPWIAWYNGTYMVTGATGTALGTGSANTTTIINAQGATATDYAAGVARACIDGGYADWCLPSKDELNKLYLNRVVIGGFGSGAYWSSSENGANLAWRQDFTSGYASATYGKADGYSVRAVRSF
jgi:hypothetical protein